MTLPVEMSAARPRLAGPRWMQRLKKGPVARSLTLAAWEGVVVGGMLAFLEAWLVPLLKVRLHASDQLIGLLTVAPMLSATLLGPIASNVIAKMGGNKRTVVVTNFIQIVAILGLSIPLHLAGASWALWVAMALAITITSVGAVGGPAWMAWMGGVIPRSIRGRYTSNRAQLHHGARLGFAIIAMLVMRQWTAADSRLGLQIVIGIAALSRLASTWLLVKAPDPVPRPIKATHTSKLAAQEAHNFMTFMRGITRHELGRWTLVWAFLHFGVMLTGPYFLVYWLDPIAEGGMGLADDPIRYTALVYISALVRLAAFPIVGRIVDRFGPSAMLRIAVVGIALVPLGWAFTDHFPLLIITEVFGGIAWCIAECCVGVLLFSCSRDPQDRARLIGYHQTVCALSIVVATLIGGQLLAHLAPFRDSPFRALLLISVAIRLMALFMALRYLPRLPEELRLKGVWRYIPGLNPTITLTRGVAWAWRRPMPQPPAPMQPPAPPLPPRV